MTQLRISHRNALTLLSKLNRRRDGAGTACTLLKGRYHPRFTVIADETVTGVASPPGEDPVVRISRAALADSLCLDHTVILLDGYYELVVESDSRHYSSGPAPGMVYPKDDPDQGAL